MKPSIVEAWNKMGVSKDDIRAAAARMKLRPEIVGTAVKRGIGTAIVQQRTTNNNAATKAAARKKQQKASRRRNR